VTRNITVKFLEVWKKINNFFTLLTMATSDILNFINTPRASTHYIEYSDDISWSLMKKIKKQLKYPLFYFHGICGKVCLTDSDFFFASLVSLDVDVTGNITANICEVWNEFSIFCKLVTMGTAPILNLFNPQICHTLRWIFLLSFMKFDERNPFF
jgi:hypothetical protein